MASAAADGTIGGEQRFDTAAVRSSAGCAYAVGIAVAVEWPVDAVVVVLIVTALAEYGIVLPAVVERLALNAAYQDASVVVSD